MIWKPVRPPGRRCCCPDGGASPAAVTLRVRPAWQWARGLCQNLQALEHALLPPTCLLCGAAGYAGRDLCVGCAADLPRPQPACPRCGDALPGAGEWLCGRCQRRPPPFDAAWAALRYAAPVDRLFVDLKFRGRLAAAKLLAQLLEEAVRAADRPEALIPVPLHRGRLRERGFNQALELARPLAHRMHLPLLRDVVVRRRATAPQTVVEAAARRRNLRGAFAVNRPLAVRHVALIDDVMTTGSTLTELSTVLKRAGVQRIQLWVAGRAQHGRV